MKKRIWIACVVTAGLCMLGSVGCIFDTRDPEPPGGEGSTWVVPDFPAKVFTNMKTGLEDLTGVNYERSLNTAFTFVPLAEDAQAFPPGKFDNWTKTVELNVTQRMLAEADTIRVDFITPEVLTQSQTEARYRARYELEWVKKAIPPATPETVSYGGTAEFDFIRTTHWELTRWTDIELGTGVPTWGFLRGELRP